MNSLLYELWLEVQSAFTTLIENDREEYVEDTSEFVVVDGEEGDYGKIKYFDKNNNELVAVKTVHGGDREDIEFTTYGKCLLGNELNILFSLAMKNILAKK